MRSQSRPCLLTAVLLSCLLVLGAPVWAEQQGADVQEGQEEIIQRILELRQQIEELLEILPEEVRQEVENRWRESQLATAPETAEPEPAIQTERVVQVAEEFDNEEVQQPESPQAAAPPCGGFQLFDTNQDSFVSAGDRPWRHLRLWIDTDGDANMDEDEIQSLFELGVRQIDVELRSYLDANEDSEDVEVDEVIRLHRIGKGSAKRPSGVLVVEADRLIRDGRIWLTDSDGVQLTSYQALGSGVFLDTREGLRLPVLCQQPE